MSYSPYLRAVAETLVQRVRPEIADPRARDALDACVRAIAGMEASLALADGAGDPLPLPDATAPGSPPRLVDDPPENLAANDRSAAQLTDAEQWLGHHPWLSDEAGLRSVRQMVDWEHAVIKAKVAGMFAIEDMVPGKAGDVAQLQLDRTALEAYLQRTVGQNATITKFFQAIGGRSRQTAVFSLEGSDLPNRLVIQRDHPAAITAEGVAQQFPVLELLSRTRLKVSRPLLLETDRSIMGAPFMIIEAASGSVAGPDYFRPPQSPVLALELAEQLALLHAVDPTPLTGTLRQTVDPADPHGWTNELQALQASWEGFAHAPSITVAAAFAWMRAHSHLIDSPVAIIHNDAAFHNILAEGGHFTSLLDFELIHLGHPAEDLGYCRPFVQDMIDWDDFIDAYVAAGGRRFSQPVLDYFSLRGGIHLMTLLQYGRNMFKTGVTSDINLAEVATSFIPKHYERIARTLQVVLARTTAVPTSS